MRRAPDLGLGQRLDRHPVATANIGDEVQLAGCAVQGVVRTVGPSRASRVGTCCQTRSMEGSAQTRQGRGLCR